CSSARTATARPRTSPEGGWCARSLRLPEAGRHQPSKVALRTPIWSGMSAAILKTLHAPQGEDGMRTLYRTYGPELYGFAVNCLRDRQLAEEVVQDVFTRVWRHADSFDASRASFRTWLYGIARNAIIDRSEEHTSELQSLAYL